MGKKRNVVIILMIMIALQLGFITYMFAFQKEGFHSDDNWSYGFANADEGGWIYHDDSGKSRNFNKWTDGKVLWDYITVQKGKQFDFGAVARNMSDERNPPLHHMILHAICSFFPETFSWWYGYAINVLSFIGMMTALYFLGKEFFLSEKKALLSCFFYGFSVAALNNMLFLRPYCLLTFFSVALLYFHVRMYRKKFSCCKKEMLGIFLIMLVGSLTQYSFFMLGLCVMTVFGIYELIRKKWKFVIAHGCVMMAAVVGSMILWPKTWELLTLRNEMYQVQMSLPWEVNFSMLLSVEESIGIPFCLPDIVFWTYVKFIVIFLLIIAAGLSFVFRHELWFKKAMKKTKERVFCIGGWLKKKVKYGDKISILMMVTVFMTTVIIAYYCNIYVMSIYADRYFFFLMPFFTMIFTGQVCWIVRHICRRKRRYYRICVALCALLLLVEHNLLVPSWYLFERQCDGPKLETLTQDADVIVVTAEAWKLTWYSSQFRNASKFYAVLAKDCMTEETLANVEQLHDDEEKPVYLIVEEIDEMYEESWNKVKTGERTSQKTASNLQNRIVDQFAKAGWKTKKKFVQKEWGFVGEIEVWQLR